MMKRLISGLALTMALLLALTACGPAQVGRGSEGTSPGGSASSEFAGSQSVGTEPFVFTRENLPQLDGSTSTVPLAQAMCAVLLGEDLDQVAELINFSRTTRSYRNLMAGEAELLLAAEPAPEVLAELEAGGQWLLTPFATDALVFVVNEDNPVDSLTREQVQKIYTGEITNWSQVGGSDLDIVPFQRNAEAGSQTMFEKLVMDGLDLMEPPKSWTSDSMMGLLEALREYDNSPAAIGYTVYYYANDMEMAKGLKVLAIDGVEPSAHSIRSGEYPFLNPYYVAIEADADQDDPARILYDWVLGSDGQRLATIQGYVSVSEVTGELGAPTARVDWSVLEKQSSDFQPDVDGGRWYPYHTGHLIPSEEYGDLVPYMGANVYQQYPVNIDGEEKLNTSSWPTPLYGLMTREGRIVVDPVYQSAGQLDFWWQGQDHPLPVLILQQVREEWSDRNEGRRYAVAAQNGSWCTDFEFWQYTCRADEVLLIGPAGLTWMDAASGNRTDWTWEEMEVPEEERSSLLEEIMWLYGFAWTEEGAFLGMIGEENGWEQATVRLFFPEKARVDYCTWQEWEAILDRWHKERSNNTQAWELFGENGEITLRRGEETHVLLLDQALTIHDYGHEVLEDLAVLNGSKGEENNNWLFRLSTGELLIRGKDISFLTDAADPEGTSYLQVQDLEGNFTFYSLELDPLLTVRPHQPHDWLNCSLRNGILTVWEQGDFSGYYDIRTGDCIFYRNLDLGD